MRDLAAVQASVQQLAAKQDEITRSIAELQKGKNVKPTPLPPPSPRAAARTANPYPTHCRFNPPIQRPTPTYSNHPRQRGLVILARKFPVLRSGPGKLNWRS